MFERIVNVVTEKKIEKYATAWEGKQATDLATVEEAEQVVKLLAENSPRFRNGMSLPQPRMLANGGGVSGKFFEVSEMLLDGFPRTKLAHLQLEYKMGNKTEMIEVFDAAQQIALYGATGYRNIFSDLDRS